MTEEQLPPNWKAEIVRVNDGKYVLTHDLVQDTRDGMATVITWVTCYDTLDDLIKRLKEIL